MSNCRTKDFKQREIRRLTKQLLEGDAEHARDRLVDVMMQDVKDIARRRANRWANPTFTYGDFVSAGLEGLARGINGLQRNKYHPNPRAYLLRCVRNALKNECHRDDLVPESTQRSRINAGREPYEEPKFESLECIEIADDSSGDDSNSSQGRFNGRDESGAFCDGSSPDSELRASELLTDLLRHCRDDNDRAILLASSDVGHYSPSIVGKQVNLPSSSVRVRLRGIQERYLHEQVAI